MIGVFVFLCFLAVVALVSIVYDARAYRARVASHKQKQAEAQQYHPIVRAKQEEDRAYELECVKLDLQQQKIDLDRDRFRLEVYLAHSRIEVAQYGTYLVNQEQTALTQLAPIHKPMLKAADAEMTPQQGYPQAPPFASIKSLIRPGKLILGYTTAGAIYGDVTDLLSMLFAGKPGTGKSTALLYYLSMLLLVDAQVYVFDHQGSLSELSGLMPYFGNFKEFGDPMPTIRKEIKEREELWRDSKQVRKPMLILGDELPAVARYEEKNGVRYGLLELAEDIVLEYRKYQVFCLLSGQSFPADILPTITRDNCSSRLLFNSSPDHARMAGLDQESRKKMLPLLKSAPQGTAILDVTRRAEPDIVAIPYTTVDDARNILGTFAQPYGRQMQGEFGDSSDVWTVEADQGENRAYEPLPGNVRTFPKPDMNEPVEQPDVTSSERPKEYRLTDEEIPRFIAAYKASGNVDRALAAIDHGARFRKHASEIVNALGLRREA